MPKWLLPDADGASQHVTHSRGQQQQRQVQQVAAAAGGSAAAGSSKGDEAESAAGHSSSDADDDMDDASVTLSDDEADSAGGSNDSDDDDDDDEDDGGVQYNQQGYLRYRMAERAAPAAAAPGMDRLLGAAEQAFMQAIHRWVHPGVSAHVLCCYTLHAVVWPSSCLCQVWQSIVLCGVQTLIHLHLPWNL
jgi:hypothetical protein